MWKPKKSAQSRSGIRSRLWFSSLLTYQGKNANVIAAMTFGRQSAEVAGSCGASCRAPSCLPRTLIVHSSEEMSSSSCCQQSRCSADVFREQCQVTGKKMPKMTRNFYAGTTFHVPHDLVFGSGPQISLLGATSAGGDWTTCSEGCQRAVSLSAFFTRGLPKVQRRMCLFNLLYSVKVSLLIWQFLIGSSPLSFSMCLKNVIFVSVVFFFFLQFLLNTHTQTYIFHWQLLLRHKTSNKNMKLLSFLWFLLHYFIWN